MKIIAKTILVSAIALQLAVVWSGECPAAQTDKTVSTSATAVKTEDSNPSGNVLDNFNDGGALNLWSGATGAFSDAGKKGSMGFTNDPQAPYEGAFCLKLNYDVSTADAYAGYYSLLESKDLRGNTILSLWVKGGAGGEYFKIELKNNVIDINRKHAAVYVTDYLDGGVTTSWQQVEIPLHNFANINDWASGKEFVITFENSQSGTNGSPKAGTVYIDNISFTSLAVNIVRIDHYGDKVNTCALGGNMGDMAGAGGSAIHNFTSASGTYNSYANGLWSQFSVSGTWGGHFIQFGGGANGITAVSHDFSEFNYFSFYIKAESAAGNPKTIKIELQDNWANRIYWATGITTGWQCYKIRLTDFLGLDKTTIKQLNFVYGGSPYGGVYIDDVQFEK